MREPYHRSEEQYGTALMHRTQDDWHSHEHGRHAERELRQDQPQLEDRWFPYLLALGLAPSVDKWFRRFGSVAGGASMRTSPGSFSTGGGSSSGGSSWTGGGGSFGGALRCAGFSRWRRGGARAGAGDGRSGQAGFA